jgi:hypothetical protein
MLGCHSERSEESPQKCSSEALASLTSTLKGRGYMFGVAGYPRGSRIETLGERPVAIGQGDRSVSGDLF